MQTAPTGVNGVENRLYRRLEIRFDYRDLFVALSEGVDAAAVVFPQCAERAAGVLEPRLDGAGVFPYLADTGIDLGV